MNFGFAHHAFKTRHSFISDFVLLFDLFSNLQFDFNIQNKIKKYLKSLYIFFNVQNFPLPHARPSVNVDIFGPLY